MTVKSRFANLDRILSGPGLRQHATDPADPAGDPETEVEPGEESDSQPQKDKPMAVDTNSEDYKAGQAAAEANARKAASDRLNTIVASEHFAGRERLASTLLASSMSADEIVGALAAAPAPAKADATGADLSASEDAKDRQAMRDKLASANNPELGADDADAGKPKADASGAMDWDKVHAEVEARRQAYS